MRTEELEVWVLSIVDAVGAGRRVEDSRVELKADWPGRVCQVVEKQQRIIRARDYAAS
jgi:hypothetical protein